MIYDVSLSADDASEEDCSARSRHVKVKTKSPSFYLGRPIKKDNKIKINQLKNLKGDWFNFLSVTVRAGQSDFIDASTVMGQHQFWSNWADCSVHTAAATVYRLAVASCFSYTSTLAGAPASFASMDADSHSQAARRTLIYGFLKRICENSDWKLNQSHIMLFKQKKMCSCSRAVKIASPASKAVVLCRSSPPPSLCLLCCFAALNKLMGTHWYHVAFWSGWGAAKISRMLWE